MAEIVLTGGTGLVGRRLASRLSAAGHQLRVATRDPARHRGDENLGLRFVVWDGRRLPAEALAGADAVVHLAGEPIFGGLPTRARRRRMVESRVASTRALVQDLAALPETRRPRTLVCASAVGYYPPSGERELVERDAAGSGFLSTLCKQWEAAAAGVEALGLRRVSLRIGIVLAAEGGALHAMRTPFSLGLGGRLGTGRQWVPWIHLEDLVALVASALDDARFSGAVNACAPAPVRNLELTRTLARVLGRPAVLPVPAFALRALLGELATELLGSRRVIPERALSLGFEFRFDELEGALRALLPNAADGRTD